MEQQRWISVCSAGWCGGLRCPRGSEAFSVVGGSRRRGGEEKWGRGWSWLGVGAFEGWASKVKASENEQRELTCGETPVAKQRVHAYTSVGGSRRRPLVACRSRPLSLGTCVVALLLLPFLLAGATLGIVVSAALVTFCLCLHSGDMATADLTAAPCLH